jgi:hypothetical protein
MITIQELMLIKEGISSLAIENEWDKEKQEKLFYEAVNAIAIARGQK